MQAFFPFSHAIVVGTCVVVYASGCGSTPPAEEAPSDVAADVETEEDAQPRIIDDRECWRHDECDNEEVCDPGAGVCTGCFAPQHCLPADTCLHGACVPGGSCFLQKDCPDDEMVCAGGACAACKKNSQCAEGLECVDHVCRGPEVLCELQEDCAGHGAICGEEDTCVDCHDDDDCPADKYCLSELCAPDACDPSAAYCDGEHRVVCSPNGSGLAATVCPEETVCVEGECASQGEG